MGVRAVCGAGFGARTESSPLGGESAPNTACADSWRDSGGIGGVMLLNRLAEILDVEMAVRAEGHANIRVPEDALHAVRVDAGPQKRSSCRVPQVVKSHPAGGRACRFRFPLTGIGSPSR